MITNYNEIAQFSLKKKKYRNRKKKSLLVAWGRSFWRLFQWRLLSSYLIMPNRHNSFLKKRTANWRLRTAETCTLYKWNGVGTRPSSGSLGELAWVVCGTSAVTMPKKSFISLQIEGLHQTRFLLESWWRIQNTLVPDSFRPLHIHAWIFNPKTKVNTLYPITVESLKQIGGKLRGNITATAAKLWLDLSSYKNCIFLTFPLLLPPWLLKFPKLSRQLINITTTLYSLTMYW